MYKASEIRVSRLKVVSIRFCLLFVPVLGAVGNAAGVVVVGLVRAGPAGSTMMPLARPSVSRDEPSVML